MNDTLQDLINKVLQWGHDRNLTDPGNLKAQTMKLVSEFGEIGAAVPEYRVQDEMDGIGDTLVVAIIIAHQLGYAITPDDVIPRDDGYPDDLDYYRAAGRLGDFVDSVLKGHSDAGCYVQLLGFVSLVADHARARRYDIIHCLEVAYDEIKDRKGVMYQGAFIKEADPRYVEVMAALGKA